MLIVACLVNIAISGATPDYEMMTGNVTAETANTYLVDFSEQIEAITNRREMILHRVLFNVNKEDCTSRKLKDHE